MILDVMSARCYDYATDSQQERLCEWFGWMDVVTVISFVTILASLGWFTLRRIRGSNNMFVLVFVTMLILSMVLDLAALWSKTNYAFRYVDIYYYESEDATTMSKFSVAYQFVGYVYYTAQASFLAAHWLFGFVYLITAVNLDFQLALDEKVNGREQEQYDREKQFSKCSNARFKVELIAMRRRQRIITYSLSAFCALMVIAIPAIQVVNNIKKEQ